jgi:hypothetical protein
MRFLARGAASVVLGVLVLSGSLLLFGQGNATAAPPHDGCSGAADQWQLQTPTDAANDFFEHLLPGQFQTPEAFAQAIDELVDKNSDDLVCTRVSKGFDLNPNSHWYQLGLEILGEPVHVLSAKDDTPPAK